MTTTPHRIRRIQASCLLVGLVLFLGVAGWSQEAATSTAIYGRVIDGAGGPPIEAGVVVVMGDRIAAVGEADAVDVPDDANIVHVADATVLPGFINTHVHRSYDADVLTRWAASGVTTVRDLGGPIDLDWDAVRDQLMEDPLCASLVISGPFITVPEGYAVTHPLDLAVTIDSVAAAQDEVRQLIDDGVDCIKIGIESYDDGARFPPEHVMPLDIATGIVQTAHEYGVPVVAHVTHNEDLLVALEAGVDQVGHMTQDLTALATLREMAERGVIWIPTLVVVGPSGTPKLGQFSRYGGIVALGTDAGAMVRVDTSMPIGEFQRMLRSGMDAMDILVAGTSNAALAVGKEKDIGTLEAGKIADILVVQGNPLQDIECLADRVLVLHRGVTVYPTAED